MATIPVLGNIYLLINDITEARNASKKLQEAEELRCNYPGRQLQTKYDLYQEAARSGSIEGMYQKARYHYTCLFNTNLSLRDTDVRQVAIKELRQAAALGHRGANVALKELSLWVNNLKLDKDFGAVFTARIAYLKVFQE